jgi:hypothetical protein
MKKKKRNFVSGKKKNTFFLSLVNGRGGLGALFSSIID